MINYAYKLILLRIKNSDLCLKWSNQMTEMQYC